MESNFIKERVNVRHDLIKKNLKSEKKSDKKNSSPNASYVDPPKRVTLLEELINEGLKQDLVEISKRVDTICQTVADYVKVRSALKVYKTNSHDVRVLTNIGCNFYAQCHIADASKVYLRVGKDYFLHMELDEAINMIDFLEKEWLKQLDVLQEKASSIKAYIKIALEAMGKVYEMDRDKLTAE